MQELSPRDLLQAAIDISGAAAPIPMRYFRSAVAVEDKADESPVTIADRETEAAIRQAIGARFPSHGIFGEEFGKQNTEADHTWIIDPIDGTRSFICGVPLFGMLLGILHKGEAIAGVIRMPALSECYAGCRGAGATLNGRQVRCRQLDDVANSRIFINEANRLVEREPQRLQRLMGLGRVRRFSNDCYPFALLAAGEIDAVVDFDLQPYDYLPVVPVVEAAGGIITDWKGARLGLGSDGSVAAASNPALHRELMDRLR